MGSLYKNHVNCIKTKNLVLIKNKMNFIRNFTILILSIAIISAYDFKCASDNYEECTMRYEEENTDILDCIYQLCVTLPRRSRKLAHVYQNSKPVKGYKKRINKNYRLKKILPKYTKKQQSVVNEDYENYGIEGDGGTFYA